MAFLQILLILTVSSVIYGQFSPPTTAQSCGLSDHFPHHIYCQLYNQCDTASNIFERSCGPGTVFSATYNVCVRPEQAGCNNWDSVRFIGRRFPAVCCNQYIEYTSAGYAFRNCSAGTVFEMSTGLCTSRTTACTDHPLCPKAPVGPTISYQCYDKPEKDSPCTYTTDYAGIYITNRPCPTGTAFDKNTCQCSIFTRSCNNGVLSYAANKALDANCRASLSLDFNSTPLVATSDKLVIGTSTNLGYYFESAGVSVARGYGNFQSKQAYVYGYFFSANQLTVPLAISVVFRWSDTNSDTFTILTNRNAMQCTPTLEAAVSYTYPGQYKVTTTVGSVQATASISIVSSNFVELLLLINGSTASGQLIERNNGVATGRKVDIVFPAVAATYVPNKCGFFIGQGLIGQVDRFTVREGCTDFSRVRV